MAERPHTIAVSEIDPPPRPPEVGRHAAVLPSQMAGVLMLLVITGLAATGVLGDGSGRASAESGIVGLVVEYPSSIRYGQGDALEVRVTNRTSNSIDTVFLSLDDAYLSRFSQIASTPVPTSAWEVALVDLGPGASQRVHLELKGDAYGRHSGDIAAFVRGRDSVQVTVSTFTFP